MLYIHKVSNKMLDIRRDKGYKRRGGILLN